MKFVTKQPAPILSAQKVAQSQSWKWCHPWSPTLWFHMLHSAITFSNINKGQTLVPLSFTVREEWVVTSVAQLLGSRTDLRIWFLNFSRDQSQFGFSSFLFFPKWDQVSILVFKFKIPFWFWFFYYFQVGPVLVLRSTTFGFGYPPILISKTSKWTMQK